MDSSKHASLPYIVWQRLLAWVVTSSLVNPFAIFLGAVAGFVIVPPDLGPFLGQPPKEPLTILLIRTLTNSIVAGSLIGISQWLIFRQFIRIRFWIPATICGFIFGMAFTYYSIDSGWIYTQRFGDYWLSVIPALTVAISQAFLIYSEKRSPIWWLIAGEASIATAIFGLSIGDSFDTLLEGVARAFLFAGIGAMISAIAVLCTFQKSLATLNRESATTT